MMKDLNAQIAFMQTLLKLNLARHEDLLLLLDKVFQTSVLNALGQFHTDYDEHH